MAKYRSNLPQLSGKPFLTDGGLETELIFLDGRDLPLFASFTMLERAEGRERLRAYYRRYAATARDGRAGFILESPTWRANPDWAGQLGYSPADLDAVNRDAVSLMEEVRSELETSDSPMVISGNLGPRGDGYGPDAVMSAEEAEAYHAAQILSFAATAADMVAAFTMNYAEEAIGIARAAKSAGIPVAISFTLETDGRLPTGQSLAEAIQATDSETASAPAYYMINCAHPAHFAHVLAEPGAWRDRIRGLRANASMRSHAELDASTDLDAGDPADLGRRYALLRRELPKLNVLGGCCGTDHRHVEAIWHACRPGAEGFPHAA